MNDLRNEIDTLFATWIKHGKVIRDDEGKAAPKAFPNLWKILKNISDPNELFIADYMPEEYVQSWMGNCKQKEHVQHVGYSVHYEALIQVCFTCRKIRVTARMKVKD